MNAIIRIVAILVRAEATLALINLYLFAENVLAEYNKAESESRMSKYVENYF